MPNLHNGAIILLSLYPVIMPGPFDRIITDTRKKGYEFGNVFDLIDFARGMANEKKKTQ